jgi:hypothetical protein
MGDESPDFERTQQRTGYARKAVGGDMEHFLSEKSITAMPNRPQTCAETGQTEDLCLCVSYPRSKTGGITALTNSISWIGT